MRDDEFREFLNSIDQARTMDKHWRLKVWIKRIWNSPWFWLGIGIGAVLTSVALR